MIVSCEPGEKSLPYVASSIGDQCIMYASDYPHPDSKWPNTVAADPESGNNCGNEETDTWGKCGAVV